MPKVKRSTPITTLAKRKIYTFVGFMKPVVHYGFIPAVVFIGMRIEPRPR